MTHWKSSRAHDGQRNVRISLQRCDYYPSDPDDLTAPNITFAYGEWDNDNEQWALLYNTEADRDADLAELDQLTGVAKSHDEQLKENALKLQELMLANPPAEPKPAPSIEELKREIIFDYFNEGDPKKFVAIDDALPLKQTLDRVLTRYNLAPRKKVTAEELARAIYEAEFAPARFNYALSTARTGYIEIAAKVIEELKL